MQHLIGKGVAGALTCKFHQAKRRETTNANADTVIEQGLLKLVMNLRLMALVVHIDKVNQNNAAQVAKPKLPGNGMGRLKVGLKHGVFKTAAAHIAPGVDINNGKRLGGVDD